jgi:hypothetical protein
LRRALFSGKTPWMPQSGPLRLREERGIPAPGMESGRSKSFGDSLALPQPRTARKLRFLHDQPGAGTLQGRNPVVLGKKQDNSLKKGTKN